MGRPPLPSQQENVSLPRQLATEKTPLIDNSALAQGSAQFTRQQYNETQRLMRLAQERQATEEVAAVQHSQLRQHFMFLELCKSNSLQQIQQASDNLPEVKLGTLPSHYGHNVFDVILNQNTQLQDHQKTAAIYLVLQHASYSSFCDVLLSEPLLNKIKERRELFPLLIKHHPADKRDLLWQMILNAMLAPASLGAAVLPRILLMPDQAGLLMSYVNYAFNMLNDEIRVVEFNEVIQHSCIDAIKNRDADLHRHLSVLLTDIMKMAKLRILAIETSRLEINAAPTVTRFLNTHRTYFCLFNTRSYSTHHKIIDKNSTALCDIQVDSVKLEKIVNEKLARISADHPFTLRGNKR